MHKSLLFGSAALLSSAIAQAEDPARPNIIFIMADDLGYSELGCYGNTFNETPVLDEMAQNGIRFTHAHTGASLSSPTRAALMTGQTPYRVGIVDFLRGNSQHMRTDITTIAEVLRDNGYHTGMIGKWHLTGYRLSGASAEVFPSERGFQEVMVSENQYIADGSYFHPYHFNKNVTKVLPGDKEFLVDRMNYEAVEFIKRNKEKPFFLYLTHYAVHTQVMGDPATVDHFRQKPGAGTSAPSAANPNNDPYTKYPADYQAKKNNPHLAAQLKHIDTGVGEILQTLRDNGLLENTLVIFTSDNGGATAVTTNAPLRGGKTSLYEGGTRVPMIFYGYGTKQGPKEIQTRITSMDFFPTFCELTQSTGPDQICDGVSVLPLLKGESLPQRDFFWYYPPIVKEWSAGRSIEASVISGDYKLIERYSVSGGKLAITEQELYDITNDPYETTNISKTQTASKILLSNKIDQWRNKIDAERVSNKTVIYVSPTGAGTQDGSSWENAATLIAGTDKARTIGDHELWLKAGTYMISSPINLDYLYIYGGFKGDEENQYDRNWHDHPVILDGNNQVSPLRNTSGDRPGGANLSIPCVLDGVIIQNGLNPSTENGGGMIVNNGAVVRNCIFRNNATQNSKNGAAFHCHGGYCIVENSLFVNNTSSGNGGAIQVGGGVNTTVRNCTFTNNKAAGPGGAIGVGTNASNVVIINSIAHNNLYGTSNYSSYGQNSDVNGGGTIVSVHSAIESTSSKFTDGDDTRHIALSRTNTPNFTSPVSIFGKGSNSTENTAIYGASYTLAKGSPCIDQGNDDEAADIFFDLACNERIQGVCIDMGAYEFKVNSNLPANSSPVRLKAFVAENEIYISGVQKGNIIRVYNSLGMPVYTQAVENDRDYTMVRLNHRGIYFVSAGQETAKVRY